MLNREIFISRRIRDYICRKCRLGHCPFCQTAANRSGFLTYLFLSPLSNSSSRRCRPRCEDCGVMSHQFVFGRKISLFCELQPAVPLQLYDVFVNSSAQTGSIITPNLPGGEGARNGEFFQCTVYLPFRVASWCNLTRYLIRNFSRVFRKVPV